MTQVVLSQKLDNIVTRIYTVATSLDTKGASSTLVKTRLRGLCDDLRDEVEFFERCGFADTMEEAYHALFDLLSYLTAALFFPGIRRGDLAHALECISTLRELTLPY